MFSLRYKLALGFGGLVAIVAIIGLVTIRALSDLGQDVDVLLRENYRSVIASQTMKEALERMDSGLLFTLAGMESEGQALLEISRPAFEGALTTEFGNITLPTERAKAEQIAALFERYCTEIPHVTGATASIEARRAAYLAQLSPTFEQIKILAQEILDLNQTNMHLANERARQQSAAARRRVALAIGTIATLALVFSILMRRWILCPLRTLIESANDIRQGNLQLVLKHDAQDELGELAQAFNAMAEGLRRARQSERLELARTKRATREVFRALPEPVAVVGPDGIVEEATESATRWFGLRVGEAPQDQPHPWLPKLVAQAFAEGRTVHKLSSGPVQHFVDGCERFFEPVAIPIVAGSPDEFDMTGVLLAMTDVTQLCEQRELKRDILSTVSHQLKTPLTSLRMGLHLLLDESVGPLNGKQVELLVTARDESERLVDILEDLLDLGRMEAGHAPLALASVAPQSLVREAVEPVLAEAKDKGVAVVEDVADNLPAVCADAARVTYVFANLLSNALRFTEPGGSITVSAEAQERFVRFTVRDTGCGVASEHLPHLFEPFYRVPGQAAASGAGLGLTISKQIVESHGGTIGAASTLHQGSTFWFTLAAVEQQVGHPC